MLKTTSETDIQLNWGNLSSMLKHPIAYHPIFAEIGGSITAGLFLSQAFYWTSRTSNPDGWFYKTSVEWEKETGLTRWQQETVRQELINRGLIEEKKQGLPCKLYFRIRKEQLTSAIAALKTAEISQNQQFEEKPQTGWRKNLKLDGGKTSNWMEEKPQTGEAENPISVSIPDVKFLPETTTDIYSKNTHNSALANATPKPLPKSVCVENKLKLEEQPQEVITQSPLPVEKSKEDISLPTENGDSDQSSAAPVNKISKKSEKPGWVCPGTEQERREFLEFKASLLVRDKRCQPIESLSYALAWANRNPEEANLLFEQWYKDKQRKTNHCGDSSMSLEVVPEFHQMPEAEHMTLLQKLIDLGRNEFIKLCSWHQHWITFAFTPLAKKRFPKLNAEVNQQMQGVLRCQEI